MSIETPRVLCVDDEPAVLEGLMNQLGELYQISTAVGPTEGLRMVSESEPFHVVVSDLRMPMMDGTQFLGRVRSISPETVRVLLTGYADVEAAIAAVNHGHIFRLLTKPCAPDTLRRAIDDCLKQYRLETADRRLLEREVGRLTDQVLRADRLATLGTLASAVGHEMNNMLAVLQSTLTCIEDARQSGELPSREDLRDLEHVKEHLKLHARNLLDLGRPSARGEARVDIASVVGETVRMIRSTGITRHVHIDVDLPASATFALVDRTRLEQVIVNLVKNAADATTDSGDLMPRISVVVRADARRDVIRCSVEDNGCGIPADKIDEIFDMYYTSKPPDRGTGLGLGVVKKIIEEHGGRLNVTSVMGKGSTFDFELPAESTQQKEEVAICSQRNLVCL